jgi:hypothetical protein
MTPTMVPPSDSDNGVCKSSSGVIQAGDLIQPEFRKARPFFLDARKAIVGIKHLKFRGDSSGCPRSSSYSTHLWIKGLKEMTFVWSKDDDKRLRELAMSGIGMVEIADCLQRTKSSVRVRAAKLNIAIARQENPMQKGRLQKGASHQDLRDSETAN